MAIQVLQAYFLKSVFFFQAEDGIRDWSVTGVQTCCSSDLVSVGVCVVSGGRLVNTYCELHFRSVD